ncbi:MAG: DUF922 domain-containing Zn-dependent protease [Snowella sp.]|nr:DUF922 domain-containing Zn-dependent protease [Snowella sp.]
MKFYWLPILLLLCLPVKAEPITDIQYRYYSIYPQQKADLEREMQTRSPIIVNGKKFKGYTKWNVNWKFWWYESPNSCRITKVKVFLNVTYTLPQIPKNHVTTAETRTIFNQFYNALFKHEQNHKDSGLFAARDIENALQNLGSFPNCQQLELVANQRGHQIIQQYAQRDRDYDKHTDHGRLEGIMLQNFMK